MASDWREVLLEDVADEITVGHVGSMAEEYVPTGVPFLRSQNVTPFVIDMSDVKFIGPEFHARLRKSSLRPGDVVIVRTGKPGTCAVIPEWLEEANCSDLVIVRPGPELDARFLAYFVNGVAGHHVSAHLVGAVQQHFNVGSARTMRLLLPPLPEQRRIAHILGTLDDKIELNRRMNETLEAMAQALFKSWFVDFDPVIDKALAAGNPIPDAFAQRAAQRLKFGGGSLKGEAGGERFEGGNPGLGLDPSYFSLFPSTFQDSPLGPIPEGWEVRPLDGIAGFLNGAACQKFPAKPGEPSLPVIKIREMTQGVAENTDRASTAVPDKYRVEDGDVLFSWSGSLLVMVWCGGTGFLNQHVFKVTSERYPKWFFLGWLRRHLAEFQQVAADKATTMGHIKRHHLSDAQTLVPPARLLETATAAIAPLLDEQVANSRQARILERTRDALLPCLLAGEMPGVEMAGQHLPAQETGGTL